MAKAPAPTQRIDPAPRPTDSVHSWTKLKNKDPGKKYCWVSLTDTNQGVDYYSAMGYEPELSRSDGVQPQGGRLTRKPGEQIQFRGNLLMSCSLQRSIEIDEVGPDGDSGQRAADAIEDRILDKERGLDPLRGQGMRKANQYLKFKAEEEHDVPVMGGD